jgi:hypothetical protein
MGTISNDRTEKDKRRQLQVLGRYKTTRVGCN